MKKSKSVDIVSFDVFGTLLVTNTSHASTVFELTEMQYQIKYGEKLEQFSERRNEIEHELWKSTADGKFTLDGIYTALQQYYSKEQCNRVKEIELKIEESFIQANHDIVPLWEDAVVHHRVIITSDMYLCSSVLEVWLQQNGFTGYSAIYISGEQKAMKADGRLFKAVEKAEGRHHFLHIGDERNGDYLRARQAGWDAILTTPLLQRSRVAGAVTVPYYGKPQTTASDIAINLVAHNWKGINGYWKRTGYYVLGPLITGFCQWLKQECSKQNINQIIFLARDGSILKKAYEKMYGVSEDYHYMYISRKAALVSVFNEKSSIQDILRITKFRRSETLGSILSRLGLDITTVPQEQREQTVTRHDLYHGKYDKLLSTYLTAIRKNCKTQRQLLEQYIASLFTSEHAAIVDVGWHGTTQNCIEEVLKSSHRHIAITGFYLGLEDTPVFNKLPYLDSTTGFDKNVVPFIRGVIETFFTATHPSVDGYEKDSDGEVVPKYSSTTESDKTQKRIRDLQSGALLFVSTYAELMQKISVDETLSHVFASAPLLNFSSAPSVIDARHFGSIEFNDVKNRPLVEKGHFGESDWKAGYLKCATRLSSFTGAMAAANGLRNKLKKN